MGIVATRSLDEEVTGIHDLIAEHEVRIRNGMKAYAMLVKLRAGEETPELRAAFENKVDLGYGFLLKRYTDKKWSMPLKSKLKPQLKILFPT